MLVEIDDKSGFCFGVVNAINKAEEEIKNSGILYSLGDIVHNAVEMKRLSELGLSTVKHEDIPKLHEKVLFIRAHGEPPTTYKKAEECGVKVIDATCPVVAKLQGSVVEAYKKMVEIDGQVVIFGKHGHAEVVGLNGQIGNRAYIIENEQELRAKVDFQKPIYFLSQTTKPLLSFEKLSQIILSESKALGNDKVIIKDTICRNVSNRGPHLQEFAKKYDLVLFISGKESSNGQVLFQQSKLSNDRCYKIEDESELESSWFVGIDSVGICGATSTPRWLMNRVKNYIIENYA
ncbi:MAG: 4-hydroxy-3-methylbut-2-enyl diphosphate reductase [Bacteroidetes bacterium]|nr:4-hydroxy-3-methylbut-2-enyl diphosphate reductase [Bacteroidota bacterium]